MNKIKSVIILMLFFIWQLPQNIIALIMFPFLGKLKKIKYNNYTWVIEAENMSGAISLGNFIFLSPYSAQDLTTIAHEEGHVKQSHYLGWLYLIVIGLPSIIWAGLYGTKLYPRDKYCYYDWYTEAWANKLNNLITIKNNSFCYLQFKN